MAETKGTRKNEEEIKKEENLIQGDSLPNQKIKKKRGRPKGWRKGKKDNGINPQDLKVPLAMIILASTKGRKKWEAKKEEAEAIETGFNKWLDLRFDKIKLFIPEIYLLMPLASYYIPRLMYRKKEEKEENKK